MDYKVIINTENNSNNQIQDISRLLNDELNNIGISSMLVNSNGNDIDKLNYINRYLTNNTLVITNGVNNNNIEIVYGLNNNDNFVSRLSNNLEENDFNVDKFYQRRDSTNTNLDYDYIIRNLPNNESIIIRYNNIDRINDLISVLTNTIKSYLGLSDDYYIVQKGDNLYSIARKFNTTVDDIKKLNNLTSNTLNIGQRLIVKSIPSTIKDNNKYYTVKSGDTLYSIALKYNMTVNELKELNKLSSNLLYTGQKLIVESTTKDNGNTYKVINGDTLYSIARRYNISVNELKKINNLITDDLSIGQVLKIPSKNVIEYIVQKGDNLYSISNKYNITVKDIMNLNNLKNTNLSINQKLIIPKV